MNCTCDTQTPGTTATFSTQIVTLFLTFVVNLILVLVHHQNIADVFRTTPKAPATVAAQQTKEIYDRVVNKA